MAGLPRLIGRSEQFVALSRMWVVDPTEGKVWVADGRARHHLQDPIFGRTIILISLSSPASAREPWKAISSNPGNRGSYSKRTILWIFHSRAQQLSSASKIGTCTGSCLPLTRTHEIRNDSRRPQDGISAKESKFGPETIWIAASGNQKLSAPATMNERANCGCCIRESKANAPH
jgi:hypothetical protein